MIILQHSRDRKMHTSVYTRKKRRGFRVKCEVRKSLLSSSRSKFHTQRTARLREMFFASKHGTHICDDRDVGMSGGSETSSFAFLKVEICELFGIVKFIKFITRVYCFTLHQ